MLAAGGKADAPTATVDDACLEFALDLLQPVGESRLGYVKGLGRFGDIFGVKQRCQNKPVTLFHRHSPSSSYSEMYLCCHNYTNNSTVLQVKAHFSWAFYAIGKTDGWNSNAVFGFPKQMRYNNAQVRKPITAKNVQIPY
jgi:hypothetical protein